MLLLLALIALLPLRSFGDQAITTVGPSWGHGKIACPPGPPDETLNLTSISLESLGQRVSSLDYQLETTKTLNLLPEADLEELKRDRTEFEKFRVPVDQAVAANKIGSCVASSLPERIAITKQAITAIYDSEAYFERMIPKVRSWSNHTVKQCEEKEPELCMGYSENLVNALNSLGCAAHDTQMALIGKLQRMESGVAYEIYSAGDCANKQKAAASAAPQIDMSHFRESDVSGQSK